MPASWTQGLDLTLFKEPNGKASTCITRDLIVFNAGFVRKQRFSLCTDCTHTLLYKKLVMDRACQLSTPLTMFTHT
ncbi:hypothetical protein Mapa_007889 [Marchantia paleacea]|nr:hypothetical protein Mapa_007889 [Marchantia paleacea]